MNSLSFMLVALVFISLCFGVRCDPSHPVNLWSSCPSGCACDEDRIWRCDNNNLVRIPAPLPENITSLTLTNQNIRTIYKDDFSGALNLVMISINYCNLYDIENGTFMNLSNLEELNLSRNRLTRIENNLFRGLYSLRRLYLYFNDIELIESEAFKNLGKLERLGLSNNDVKTIDVDLFRGLHTLKQLSIQSNGIERIHNETFMDLNSLIDLRLDANDIEDFDDGTFGPLVSLRMLFIGINKLTCLNALFSISPTLEYLNLDFNDQLSLPKCSLGHLHNLQALSVRHTSVNFSLELFFDHDLCENETVLPLRTLYIQSSKTDYISVNLTRALSSLTHLSLGGDNISLEEGSLELLHQLTSLSIYDNNLPPSFYQQIIKNPLPELKRIYFYYLMSVPKLFLSKISDRLNYVGITFVQFEELPREAFGNISSLYELSLTSHRYVVIHREALKGLPNLRRLYLYSPYLSTLPNGLFDHNPQLQLVYLSGNYLSCNCSLAWLVYYRETNSVTIRGECHSPISLAGTSLSSLAYNDLNCTEETTTGSSGSTENWKTELQASQKSADDISTLSFEDLLTHVTDDSPIITQAQYTTPLEEQEFRTAESVHENSTITKNISTQRQTTKRKTQSSSRSITHSHEVKATSSISTSDYRIEDSIGSTSFPLTSIILVGLGVIILILVSSLLIVARKLYYAKRTPPLRRRGKSSTKKEAEDGGNVNESYYETVENHRQPDNDYVDSAQCIGNIPLQITRTSTPPVKNYPQRKGSIQYENSNYCQNLSMFQ